MKKSIKKRSCLGIAALAAAMLLGGCGEELYELEDGEREAIVNYAAHIVAKYNVKQPEGYQYVYVPEEEEEPEAEEVPQDAPEDSGQTPSNGDSQDGGGQEAGQQDSGGDGQGSDGVSADAGPDAQDASDEQPSVTLTEALGLKHVNAVYTGAELVDQYDMVVPNDGKQLLILHVTLENPTKKARSCDILSELPDFRVTVNGGESAKAELSLLPENLGTWEEKIPAESSADAIIMFQVGKDLDRVEQLEMDVTVGDRTGHVVFM